MAMESRILGKTKLEVGVIGLGTEHLELNRENVDSMLDIGVEMGLNYIDLLFNDLFMVKMENMEMYWHALENGINRHREKLILCLHWGYLYEQPIELCQQYFEKTLSRIKNGYAEIAMISMVDTKAMWENWASRALELLNHYREKGDFGHIGLSNHNPEVALMAVESGLIDILMFPVNLYQHPLNPNRAKLLDACHENRVGVVAMKPFYGGILIEREGKPTGITPIQCLHYVLSQPVATVVPGLKNVNQLLETIKYLSAREEEKQFSGLAEDLEHWLHGQCVRCGHCLPCPQEIRIPLVIYHLNYVKYYGNDQLKAHNTEEYNKLSVKASDCIECEICLERCPFEVDIISKMHDAVEIFGC
jgi:uncharacterized protein